MLRRECVYPKFSGVFQVFHFGCFIGEKCTKWVTEDFMCAYATHAYTIFFLISKREAYVFYSHILFRVRSAQTNRLEKKAKNIYHSYFFGHTSFFWLQAMRSLIVRVYWLKISTKSAKYAALRHFFMLHTVRTIAIGNKSTFLQQQNISFTFEILQTDFIERHCAYNMFACKQHK